jgi:hypothetical protein
MTKSFIAFLVFCGLVLGGIAGFALHGSNSLGGTVNYTNSGGSANLYNSLASIVTDITALRVPENANSATTSIGFAALGPLGATTSTTSTAITVASSVFGDYATCLYTSTSSLYETVGQAQSGTVLCTVINVSTTAQTLATGTMTAYRIPAANFLTPAALTTTTSTSN